MIFALTPLRELFEMENLWIDGLENFGCLASPLWFIGPDLADGEEQTIIECNPSAKNIKIDFEQSSLDKSIKHYELCMNFMRDKPNRVVTEQVAPFELRNGEKLELQIFIDRSILEVFANGRQCITQRIYPTRRDSTGIELFSKGGSMTVKSLQAWDMAATNPW